MTVIKFADAAIWAGMLSSKHKFHFENQVDFFDERDYNRSRYSFHCLKQEAINFQYGRWKDGGGHMKNNLLFINQNQEIIQEFLSAMKGYSFDIDTADGGLAAAAFIKKKRYKVVITGMNLSKFDGSRLIAYLNQYCPWTVCIVYTRRLELAHLKLLVNERKVFRIFQKSADFRGEVYEAIMAAFEVYDLKEKQQQEKQILEQKLRNGQAGLIELKQGLLGQNQKKQQLAMFLQMLLKVYAKNVKIALSKKERHLLFWYETELMSHILEAASCSQEGLENIKHEMYAMCSSVEWQKLGPVVERIHAACLGN